MREETRKIFFTIHFNISINMMKNSSNNDMFIINMKNLKEKDLKVLFS